MRYYNWEVMDGGYRRGIIQYGMRAYSPAKIRTVACILFRKWFGDPCQWHWHEDGFMAEARDDRRHRCITVTQINRDMTPIALLPAHPEGGER